MNTISPQQLKEKLGQENIFLCDVRELHEYQDWHIAGSTNLPLSQLSQQLILIPKEKTIITICAHGIRSEKARQFLSQQGYTAFTMAGGMVAWNSVYDIAIIPISEGEIIQFRRIGKGCLSYMIISKGKALVIDPTLDISTYREAAQEKEVKIIGVLDTHTQADHISGSRKLADETNAVYYSADKNNKFQHQSLRSGEVISGGAIRLQVFSTPGHTPESITFLLDNIAFTGDTLFVDSVGRPDLGENLAVDATLLWESIQQLLQLPDATGIFPAHYNQKVLVKKNVPLTISLGELRSRLPQSKEEFITLVTSNAPPKPANFEVMVNINRSLEFMDEEEIRELEAGPNRCAVN